MSKSFDWSGFEPAIWNLFALISVNGIENIFLEESIIGRIAIYPKGENGYHWDTIFIPEGENRTFAEMTFEEKQSFAVTKKLLRKFKELHNNKLKL